MPGLIAMREEYGDSKPLSGARITGSLHMTIQTAVLIETLTALGATFAGRPATSSYPGPCRGRGCRPERFARGPAGDPRVRLEGRDLEEYWWCTEQVLDWPEGGPNMILDDGGDATLLVHKGAEFEKAGVVPSSDESDSEEYRVILHTLRESLANSSDRFTKIAAGITGVRRKPPRVSCVRRHAA